MPRGPCRQVLGNGGVEQDQDDQGQPEEQADHGHEVDLGPGVVHVGGAGLVLRLVLGHGQHGAAAIQNITTIQRYSHITTLQNITPIQQYKHITTIPNITAIQRYSIITTIQNITVIQQ